MEIFENSIGGCKGDQLIGVSSQQIDSVCLVANVNQDSGSLRNDVVSVDKIGQVYGWIFCKQFGFVNLEPLVFFVLIVLDLLIGQLGVFKKLSGHFAESSKPPIPQHHFCLCHQRYFKDMFKYKYLILLVCDHFHAAVQLLQGLSLNLQELKQAESSDKPQTRFWCSTRLGQGFKYSALSKPIVCIESATEKSMTVRFPQKNSLLPKRPLSFFKQGSKIAWDSLSALSKVLFSSQTPQASRMQFGWKSLKTPCTVASCTCSSAILPRSSGLPALQQRCTMMASLQVMTLSPSSRQGRVRAGFLQSSLGLSSLNHLALPQAPQYLTSLQAMPRYSRTCLMRSPSPRIAQQPNLTVTSYIKIFQQKSYFNQAIKQKWSFLEHLQPSQQSLIIYF